MISKEATLSGQPRPAAGAEQRTAPASIPMHLARRTDDAAPSDATDAQLGMA